MAKQRSLWAMADLVTPMALRVAATLRLADHIAAGRRTAPKLAAATNANADALDRLLRHLVGAGVFSRDADGRYALTELSETLRDGHPAGLRWRLDIEGAIGRADLAFVQLLHAIRSGEAAFPVQFGRSFWDDLAADPARAAAFDAEMGADAVAWARDVVPAYNWGALGHVVDIGGGNGTLLIALLRAYSALRGTLLDLPGAVAAARQAFAAADLADRATAVAGSFFEPLPRGAGGYLLMAILHDWPDAAARTILRRCAEAAGRDGRVFVIERVGADGESPRTEMDLRMLAYFGGRERGVAQIAALAAETGLRLLTVHPAGSLGIVELIAG